MNTFKRKSVYVAVLAGLGAAGAIGTAEAVHVNPDGMGQVLLYPYYTVRNPKGVAANKFDTYVAVTNTTNQVKAVKVRFLEGRRSAEVLDFNLFLSPYDMWTAAVVRTNDGAMLISHDNSCTLPTNLFAEKNASSAAAQNQQTPNVFKNYQYQSEYDGDAVGLDRTREGHFEIIEMGVVTAAPYVTAATHLTTGTNAGKPGNCSVFNATEADTAAFQNLMLPPNGGLFGRASLVSALTGVNFTYDAVALDQWRDAPRYSSTGATFPAITEATPPTSRVFTGGGMVQADWFDDYDAVSAVLMHDSIANEYVIDTDTGSGTDWIITFPTKSAHVSPNDGQIAGGPFLNNYNDGSCEAFTYQIWDREELQPSTTTVILPSPIPNNQPQGNTLCWETNVISFSGTRQGPSGLAFTSNLLGSTLGTEPINVNNQSDPFKTVQNGWVRINFAQATQAITPFSASLTAGSDPVTGLPTVTAITGTHNGLPAIGLMVHDYVNNAFPGSRYGGVVTHKYTRNITP